MLTTPARARALVNNCATAPKTRLLFLFNAGAFSGPGKHENADSQALYGPGRVAIGLHMLKNVLVITLGAGAGACLRWLLSMLLNSLFPAIPLGTVAANFLGGFGIGLSLGVFNSLPGLAPEWRLLVITGFLGGLTTFSTFTAEVGTLLQEQRFGMAAGAITLHVCGSLICFFMGLGAVSLLKSLFR